jgi:hypothetical protein
MRKEVTHMKDRLFTLIIFITIVMICSVSCSKIHSPSEFLTRFSLNETIKRMNVGALEISSAGNSQSASGGNPSKHRRDYDMYIQIKEERSGGFNENGFLAMLKQQIELEATNSGVRISGGGSANDAFHIDYNNGKHEGGIEVIALRIENNKYRVWCIIRELS